ncbi:3-phosphoserine/phosphohydroxythreonine transaminase [Putridiphycobacter roseus]|uniref:Phosphoserine aminotransferase n=1 Tax=Putridiphycobacter roseus TaxID=2219161 RepID=A0A2W1N1N5_9FLAO|nr:3-phosphoserine/phosphohydroxythreonine transaminase [Putridiphycobacter roseus]PZE17714.1 3-phosphoserine/phosphohydroxythreonine transaminase [Putridiphycobacter roseus]
MSKQLNFGAGPCILPQEVFEEASKAVLNFNGLSILEISHRSPDFVAVMDEAIALVKKSLNVPEGYAVMFLQGGASLGFLISAMNMARKHKKAAYIDTGVWSAKAIKEAVNAGLEVDIIASSKADGYKSIPNIDTIDGDYDFVHYTSNNTIYGTQFKKAIDSKIPVVCDMSSDIFSKEINVADFDIIYAGAQKNLGPAGATLYIVKESILGQSSIPMPSYLNLKTHFEKDSMFNTPPVFSIYTSMLNLRYLLKTGGVAAIEKVNQAKADLLYTEIDANPLFMGNVNIKDRSNMNVTFVLTHEELTDEFNAAWKKANIVGLKGHRSAGGFRASMYNALPLSSVEVLVQTMKEFTAEHISKINKK